MDSKLEHADLRATPQGKDLERLNGMFEQYNSLCEQVGQSLNVSPIVDGVQYRGNLTIVNASASLDFKGIALCPHCIGRASLLLRDLANTLDDMVVEAKKHASA